MAPDQPEQDALTAESREWNGLPVDSLKDAAAWLRRPFTANAVKWKVQASFPTKKDRRTEQTKATSGLLVSYIDARLVIERLNAFVPHLWFATFTQAEGDPHFIRCYLTIRHTNFERLDVTRTDVGTGRDLKAKQSDALKRAAVHFGIGVSLYAIEQQFLSVGSGKLKLRLNRGFEPIIDAETLAGLRSMYGGWLESPLNTFGKPIDHGDVENSAGDVEVETPAPAADEGELELPRLDSPNAMALVDKIGAANKGQYPAAALKAMVEAAQRHPDTSRLEALLRRLTTTEVEPNE